VQAPDMPADGVWAEHVAPGGYTHKVIARGTAVRLANPEAGACAHVLLYNADQSWERLNVADTVKVQWNAYLNQGNLLLSDQGRVLASVSEADGDHDALCGTTPKGRGLFTLAAAKNGLTPRDLPPSLSFFQSVRVREDGKLDYQGASGTAVVLKAELPLVILIANTAHPLDETGACTRLEVTAWRDSPTTPDHPLWTSTPVGRRAFENNADYLAARGLS
jgi:uncharacterized protein YcgI (DUF1989 family)